MPRNYLLYLKDMNTSAQKVKRYTQNLTFADFEQAEQTIDATLHNLEIIGEAAKSIPEEMRAKYPNIAWRSIARFRDVLAHHYFGVRLETVWDIVENEIPLLLTELDRAIEQESKSE